MNELSKHIINHQLNLADALQMLNDLGEDLTLFVVNDEGQLIGTVTDGDSRRGLLNGLGISDSVTLFMQEKFRFIVYDRYEVSEISDAKQIGIKLLPVVDEMNRIIRIINFCHHKSYLPLTAVIMAGGEGVRLRPLTQHLPKPLLNIGDKPIMEYGVDWLRQYGIEEFNISINYLGHKIEAYFGDGTDKNISISYIEEKSKLGTIGALSLIKKIKHNHLLVLNSDLLTNFDLEDFYNRHVQADADMSIACIPYNVDIPYAIMDTDHENVLSLREKPKLTYQANAGIYLIKKEHLGCIEKDKFFNATDLIDLLIESGKKVIYYPLLGYWLDIGKMDDYLKAQEDIKYIKF